MHSIQFSKHPLISFYVPITALMLGLLRGHGRGIDSVNYSGYKSIYSIKTDWEPK